MMFVTTMSAFVYKLVTALGRHVNGALSPDYFIALLSLVLLVIAAVVAFEAFTVFKRRLSKARVPVHE